MPPTVLFIHSIAGAPEQWHHQLDRLGGSRDAVAVTLAGHAGAEAARPTTVEALAASIEADVTASDRVVLVGHSGGALVAAHLAARHPDRVAGLFLVDPGTDGRTFPREASAPMLAALRSEAYPHAAADHWRSLLSGATEATRARVMEDLGRTDPSVIPDFFESLHDFDPVSPLRAVAAERPVAAVTTPLGEGPHALVDASEHIEVEHVEAASHWVQLDRPDVVNAALDRLLARVDG